MEELRSQTMGQQGIPEVSKNRKLLWVLVLEGQKVDRPEAKAIKLDLETWWGLSSGRWDNNGRACLSRARISHCFSLLLRNNPG